jgi:hypothetical protein
MTMESANLQLTKHQPQWNLNAVNTISLSALGKWSLEHVTQWTDLKSQPAGSKLEQERNEHPDTFIAKTQFTNKIFDDEPLIPNITPVAESINASIIQIWEGEVKTVDQANGIMQVELNAKLGKMDTHSGEIEFRLVPEQDLDLVRPGAIFYLTLSNRIDRGSIENVQELRFRRRPSWTKQQIEQVWRDADSMASNLIAKPLAE